MGVSHPSAGMPGYVPGAFRQRGPRSRQLSRRAGARIRAPATWFPPTSTTGCSRKAWNIQWAASSCAKLACERFLVELYVPHTSRRNRTRKCRFCCSVLRRHFIESVEDVSDDAAAILRLAPEAVERRLIESEELDLGSDLLLELLDNCEHS